jgi:hypothetical protein
LNQFTPKKYVLFHVLIIIIVVVGGGGGGFVGF